MARRLHLDAGGQHCLPERLLTRIWAARLLSETAMTFKNRMTSESDRIVIIPGAAVDAGRVRGFLQELSQQTHVSIARNVDLDAPSSVHLLTDATLTIHCGDGVLSPPADPLWRHALEHGGTLLDCTSYAPELERLLFRFRSEANARPEDVSGTVVAGGGLAGLASALANVLLQQRGPSRLVRFHCSGRPPVRDAAHAAHVVSLLGRAGVNYRDHQRRECGPIEYGFNLKPGQRRARLWRPETTLLHFQDPRLDVASSADVPPGTALLSRALCAAPNWAKRGLVSSLRRRWRGSEAYPASVTIEVDGVEDAPRTSTFSTPDVNELNAACVAAQAYTLLQAPVRTGVAVHPEVIDAREFIDTLRRTAGALLSLAFEPVVSTAKRAETQTQNPSPNPVSFPVP